MAETPEEFFARSGLGLLAYAWMRDALASYGDGSVRVTTSQVAFRRRRGFAYLWLPGRYLTSPQAEVVLSLALPYALDSPRFKEVVHPATSTWMHHLEVRSATDLDDEVRGWVTEAADLAG